MKAEVAEVAMRLFGEQGFANTSVDQIAGEAGMSRATFFRYFGTKEDVLFDNLEEIGRTLAVALAERPDDEDPWVSLRRTFDAITATLTSEPERSLRLTRMLSETPSLRARHWEKQLGWQEQLMPEVLRRVGAHATDTHDPRARALVSSALACLDAATEAWLACHGETPLPALIDRAMGALGPHPAHLR
ncbi:TetR family transcriptional regulator [Nocardia jinanensis]|uniref:TetR family transcriptional regulator n=2 Tax=Nocardia jinanensis TaxID=382504 RepID=A0A917RLY2_9NOCA|nr:TetR family transcriptional regulator [Nocardia jinanensis]